MGHRDENGLRLEWTPKEKSLVRELKARRLKPEVLVLEQRGRAAQLGKFPMIPTQSTPEMINLQWG